MQFNKKLLNLIQNILRSTLTFSQCTSECSGLKSTKEKSSYEFVPMQLLKIHVELYPSS